MPFLTELHCHTSPASVCARSTPQEVADRYIAAGYSTLVLTNHYSDSNFDNYEKGFTKQMEHFLADYHAMKEYAGDRLHVLLGAEIRTHADPDDYLVYGLTEELLWEYTNLHCLKIRELSPFFHKHGAIVVQAHPFRNGMRICDPKLLDGIEIFNGANSHDSRDDIAETWARKWNLIPTSGSDYHYATHEVSGGIYTDTEITSAEQLVEVLKSRDYTIRRSGENAVREGLSDISGRW